MILLGLFEDFYKNEPSFEGWEQNRGQLTKAAGFTYRGLSKSFKTAYSCKIAAAVFAPFLYSSEVLLFFHYL